MVRRPGLEPAIALGWASVPPPWHSSPLLNDTDKEKSLSLSVMARIPPPVLALGRAAFGGSPGPSAMSAVEGEPDANVAVR
jgi:hypothetical protein